MAKLIKIFDFYINPEMVTSVQAFEDLEGKMAKFRIQLSGSQSFEGRFGKRNGELKHTVEDLVDAIQNGKDLVD